MDTNRNFKEEKQRCFVDERADFWIVDRRDDGGNIHLAVVMPGAGLALLVTREGVAGMIVGDGHNDPDAHVKRADDHCYPTPFHPISHS